jgi:ribosomal protein S18 acetylase RimI-like enzyme
MIRSTLFTDQVFLIDAFKEEGILEGFPMTNDIEIVDSCSFWTEMALKGYGLTYEVEGDIAAMAVLYIPIYDKLKKAALFSIVVGKNFRRQNIGYQLISALEELGTKKYGLKIIHLEVYEKNQPAIRLYEKLGYKKYGVQEKFIKDKGQYFSKILMEKRF